MEEACLAAAARMNGARAEECAVQEMFVDDNLGWFIRWEVVFFIISSRAVVGSRVKAVAEGA